MPTMHIYQAGRKVESREFLEQFTILREISSDDKLFWVIEREPKLGEGAFVITIRKKSQAKYEIDSIPTDWQLTLDDTVMAPGVYFDVNVSGRLVELEHGDYRFVCSFPRPENECEFCSKDDPPYREFLPLPKSEMVPLTMHIYKAGKRIEAKEFLGQFSIVRNKKGELYWLADDEWGPGGGGVVCIWIVGGGVIERKIKCVPLDWQLTIDDVAMEHGAYLEVYVSGKTVELKSGDHCFVCSFPPFEGKILRSEDAPPYIFIPAPESEKN